MGFETKESAEAVEPGFRDERTPSIWAAFAELDRALEMLDMHGSELVNARTALDEKLDPVLRRTADEPADYGRAADTNAVRAVSSCGLAEEIRGRAERLAAAAVVIATTADRLRDTRERVEL